MSADEIARIRSVAKRVAAKFFAEGSAEHGKLLGAVMTAVLDAAADERHACLKIAKVVEQAATANENKVRAAGAAAIAEAVHARSVLGRG